MAAAAVPVEGEVSPDLLGTIDSLSALGDEELWRLAREPAPVAALQLNRSSLVLARSLWVGAGWHPPLD